MKCNLKKRVFIFSDNLKLKIKAKDEYGLVMAATKVAKKLKEQQALSLPTPDKPVVHEGVHPATPLLMLTAGVTSTGDQNRSK